MTGSIDLLVNATTGEQRVRPPRPTDAIGASLRRAIATAAALPDDMAALLRTLDQMPDRRAH